jgi:hypothetical protein
MLLVPLLNPKFASERAAKSCELRVRGTRPQPIVPILDGATGSKENQSLPAGKASLKALVLRKIRR